MEKNILIGVKLRNISQSRYEYVLHVMVLDTPKWQSGHQSAEWKTHDEIST